MARNSPDRFASGGRPWVLAAADGMQQSARSTRSHRRRFRPLTKSSGAPNYGGYLETGSTERRRGARRSGGRSFNDPQLNAARRAAQYFEPEHRRGGSQCPGGAGHDPGSPGAVLSDDYGQSGHHQFTFVDGVRPSQSAHVQHVTRCRSMRPGSRICGAAFETP